MGLWTVLMEVMKAAAVSPSQMFIFLNFLHNKALYSSCFGVGTTHAAGTEFLFCDSNEQLSVYFRSGCRIS